MIDYVGTANDAVDYYMQMDAYDDILSRTIDFTCRKPDMPLWVEFVSVEFADGRNSFASDEAIDFVFEVKGNKDVDATRQQVLRFVILPAALPHILTGIRIGLGVGWSTLVDIQEWIFIKVLEMQTN